MRLPFVRQESPREVVVAVGPSVPAVVVRVALGLLGLATVLVAFAGPGPSAHGFVAAALVAVVVAAVLRPGLGLAAVVVAIAGARVLLSHPPAVGEVLTLVVLVHLTLWTAALAARTTWRASIEWAVIGPELRRVAVVQVFALVLAVLAMAVTGASAGDLWRAVGVVCAVAVTVLVLPRASADG